MQDSLQVYGWTNNVEQLTLLLCILVCICDHKLKHCSPSGHPANIQSGRWKTSAHLQNHGYHAELLDLETDYVNIAPTHSVSVLLVWSLPTEMDVDPTELFTPIRIRVPGKSFGHRRWKPRGCILWSFSISLANHCRQVRRTNSHLCYPIAGLQEIFCCCWLRAFHSLPSNQLATWWTTNTEFKTWQKNATNRRREKNAVCQPRSQNEISCKSLRPYFLDDFWWRL